eukprot:TCONS_00058341-protein
MNLFTGASSKHNVMSIWVITILIQPVVTVNNTSRSKSPTTFIYHGSGNISSSLPHNRRRSGLASTIVSPGKNQMENLSHKAEWWTGNETAPTAHVENLLEYCSLFKQPLEDCNCTWYRALKPKGNLNFCRDQDQLLTCTLARRITNRAIIGISTIGIFGNLLVLVVTGYHRHRITVCRRIIGMLAFSDLLFSLVQLVIYFPAFWTCLWIYETIMCKILRFAVHAFCMISLGFVMIIAFERFNGIVKPFQIRVSNKKIYLTTILNIVWAITFSIPLIIHLDVIHGGECTKNWSDPHQALIYDMVLVIGTFLFPIIVTSVLYILIVKSLYQVKSETGSIIGKQQKHRRRREDRRITSIIAYLLVSFVILVAPNRLLNLLHGYGVFDDLAQETYSYLQLAAMLPYAIHASINPLIYSIIDRKFRKNVRMLFYKVTNQEKKAFSIVNSEKHLLGAPHNRESSIISDV